MKELLREKRFSIIRKGDKDFIAAFSKSMDELGYTFDGVIGEGFCWGKYMIIYRKASVKNKNVLARIYIRDEGLVLRLYLNNIDKHRAYIENAPDYIKSPFLDDHGVCKHCKNEKGASCKFRKTYTIDGRYIEKCNGVTFEFHNPNCEKLSGYVDLLNEFIRGKKRGGCEQ